MDQSTIDKPIDCLVVGTRVADMLVRPVPLGEPVGGGRLIHVDPIGVTTGGVVCNTGIGLQRLGLRVAAASLVGEDVWGGLIRERLVSEGIDVSSLETHPTLATSTTAALIDPAGERSFAHHVGAPAALDKAFLERHLELICRSRYLIIGYIGLLPALEPELAYVVSMLRKTGCRVVLETGGSGGSLAHIAPAMPQVDCYVPSLAEAAHQTGLDDPRAIIARYRDVGCSGIVGVKLGTRGVLLSAADTPGDVLEIPCVPAPGPVADTTGAGDAFLAGLITGLIQNRPLPEAGRLGAAAAACCVTGVGATAGLRSLAETWAVANH